MNQTELESIVSEEAPEEPIDNSALTNSTIAYNAAIIILELGSSVMVGMLTFWYYGIVWFLSGAISFNLHHKNWDSSLNNDKQQANAQTGMIVSVLAVVVMALLAGAAMVNTKYSLVSFNAGWFSALVELFTVGLFCWHGFQFAMYRFADDSFNRNKQIAKAKANANKKIEIAKAAGSVVAANQKYISERDAQYQKYGDKGAVDAVLAKITGMPTVSPAMSTNQATVDGVELKNTTPKADAGKPNI